MEFREVNKAPSVPGAGFDVPAKDEGKGPPKSQLQARRRVWLKLHDQTTDGIMGVLPLVRVLPVRFACTQGEERCTVKNACGVLVGWEFEAVDAARAKVATEPEMVLEHMSRALHVRVNRASWPVEKGWETGVYKLTPKRVTWSEARDRKATVYRCGFIMVPDLNGTVHSFSVLHWWIACVGLAYQ